MKKPHPRDPDYAETKPLWLEHVKIRRKPQVIETVRTVERVKQVPGPERVVFRDRVIEPDMTKIEAAVERLRKAKEKMVAPPDDLKEYIRTGETYEQTNMRLLPIYREAQHMKERAIDHVNKNERVFWENKIRKLDLAMHWMHGRMIETV